MHNFVPPVLLPLSCLIPRNAYSNTPPCVDEKQPMRVRIDIPVAKRMRLVACQSRAGTQIFVNRLDKDLKPINETILESPRGKM
jgi:hypothetical protein